MSFAGVIFLGLFLPLAVLTYWLAPRRTGVQNAILLAVSWLFYASWGPKLLAVIWLTTLVNFLGTRALESKRPPEDAAADDPKKQRLRRIFWSVIAFDVGQLVLFKYLGFMADSVNDFAGAFGLQADLPVLSWILPLGISFWTLQQIAWIVDVYYGRPKFSPTALEFAVFSAFFPQVVSGPIPRGDELLPQLAQPRTLSPDLIAAGVGTFLLGYVLKFFVADILAQFLVNPVFADLNAYSAIGLLLGLVGYAFQVFGDFAGYSIMAIGAGRLFGLELPVNFTLPFFSRDMMEFWRRWHITLNRFLFDYLYWPLVARRGFWRQRLDLGFFVVFALSGLWHGATWNFVAWGAIHGVALATHRRYDQAYRGLCRKDRKWVARRRAPAYGALAWALTQAFFVFSLIPFRAPDFGATLDFFRGLARFDGLHHPLAGLPTGAVSVALAVFALAAYHGLWSERGTVWRQRFEALPAPLRGAAYGVIIVVLLLFMPVGSGTFIYAQF